MKHPIHTVGGVLVLASSFAVACGQSAPEKAATKPDDGKMTAPTVAATFAGGSGTPYHLAQLSIRPGTTGVGVDAPMVFDVRPDGNGIPEPNVADLAARATYVAQDGTKINAAVQKVTKGSEGIVTGFPFSIEFRPATPLNDDSWYWFVFRQDAHVAIAAPKDADGNFSSHFFTGSAPHVVRMERSLKAPTMTVYFSEPVDLATLSSARSLVTAGGAVARCIALDNGCTETGPSDHVWADYVELRLASPMETRARVVLSLPEGMQGSGRTIAGSAQLARVGRMTARRLERAVAPEEWAACPGGDRSCWTERVAVGTREW